MGLSQGSPGCDPGTKAVAVVARGKGALGHPTQCQHIEADVAHPHGLVQVKLDDGDLLQGTLVTQQAATVTAGEGHIGDQVTNFGQ